MDATLDLLEGIKVLDLATIRFQLIRLEDTITFHLIERCQFPLNAPIYSPAALPIPSPALAPSSTSPKISLFDWMLREQERFHSRVRRYQAPDEYPFFPEVLESTILPAIAYPKVLHPNSVNVNAKIRECYVNGILPAICTGSRKEAQETFGSAATCDVAFIQALSRRIHFGKFVAEAKFLAETERFVKLIRARDVAGINVAITNAKVEETVLERLKLKAKTYGTDPGDGIEAMGKVDVEAVGAMYKDFAIPLTKEVEVEYLLQRLKGTEWE